MNGCYIGNDNGEIFVYKINYSNDSKEPIVQFNLSSKKVVRKALLTDDLQYLLAVTDDGKLWVHDISDSTLSVLKELVD